MFDFLSRKKKKGPSFDPRVEISQLSQMSPPSTLVYLPKPGGDDEEPDDLGKAFFLRRDKKIYSEGANIYITSPDNLKSSSTDNTLNNKVVKLQFFSRRVPHSMECRVVGRFRLLPEISKPSTSTPSPRTSSSRSARSRRRRSVSITATRRRTTVIHGSLSPRTSASTCT